MCFELGPVQEFKCLNPFYSNIMYKYKTTSYFKVILTILCASFNLSAANGNSLGTHNAHKQHSFIKESNAL